MLFHFPEKPAVGMGLKAWISVIAILLPGRLALACWKEFEAQRRAGVKEPRSVTKACGVERAVEG